jgi:hypothetical protein
VSSRTIPSPAATKRHANGDLPRAAAHETVEYRIHTDCDQAECNGAEGGAECSQHPLIPQRLGDLFLNRTNAEQRTAGSTARTVLSKEGVDGSPAIRTGSCIRGSAAADARYIQGSERWRTLRSCASANNSDDRVFLLANGEGPAKNIDVPIEMARELFFDQRRGRRGLIIWAQVPSRDYTKAQRLGEPWADSVLAGNLLVICPREPRSSS